MALMAMQDLLQNDDPKVERFKTAGAIIDDKLWI